MIDNFIHSYLDESVENLKVFCDGCAGQNKNFTVLRYFHYMTVERKRFKEVTIVFPVRGHSYMEPDKNMGLLPRHSEAETPEDYREIMRSARTKPCPFEVVSFQRENFKQWGSFLAPKYTKRFTAPRRPIKEVRISQNKVRTIDHRDTRCV